MMRGLLSLTALLGAWGATAAAPTDWAQRLVSLHPQEPMAYFELGEEVMAESSSAEDTALARSLFALAYDLDREGGGRLGPSVCLALASLAESEEDRRVLAALAALVGGESLALTQLAPPAGAPGAAASDEVAHSLAVALGHYRAGEYDRASALLDRPEVDALLESYDSLLAGAASRIRREARSKPSCRECRNQRVVRDGSSDESVRLCPTCGGNPGPVLDTLSLVRLLRVEAMLLAADRSWSEQIAADGGAPLPEWDASTLAARFGADASRPFWREGRWVSEVNAAALDRTSPPAQPRPPSALPYEPPRQE